MSGREIGRVKKKKKIFKKPVLHRGPYDIHPHERGLYTQAAILGKMNGQRNSDEKRERGRLELTRENHFVIDNTKSEGRAIIIPKELVDFTAKNRSIHRRRHSGKSCYSRITAPSFDFAERRHRVAAAYSDLVFFYPFRYARRAKSRHEQRYCSRITPSSRLSHGRNYRLGSTVSRIGNTKSRDVVAANRRRSATRYRESQNSSRAKFTTEFFQRAGLAAKLEIDLATRFVRLVSGMRLNVK